MVFLLRLWSAYWVLVYKNSYDFQSNIVIDPNYRLDDVLNLQEIILRFFDAQMHSAGLSLYSN